MTTPRASRRSAKSQPLGPAPPSSSPAVTHSMKSNRGKGTLPELNLRKALRAAGVSGFVPNFEGAPGRPDVAFPTQKVAVMVYGDFWHRCPICKPPLPKTHRDFWRRKFALNRMRDQRIRKALATQGWRLVEIWECQLKANPTRCANRVRAVLHVTRSRFAEGGRHSSPSVVNHGASDKGLLAANGTHPSRQTRTATGRPDRRTGRPRSQGLSVGRKNRRPRTSTS